jgi:hypothetical protein
MTKESVLASLVLPNPQPAVAGDSVKPGVERSGTPGPHAKKTQSPRSGRQRMVKRIARHTRDHWLLRIE